VSWNRAAETIYGWPAAEVVGKTLRQVIPTAYVTGSREEAIRDLETKGIWRGELLMTRRDGATRSIFASVSRTVGRDGRPTGAVAVNRDITDRKRLEAALAQSQRMESVGRLAGGVAHDFNNALQAILNLAELALDRIGPDHKVAADLRGIQATARRSADLARQLLAFARQQTAQPRVVDLNERAAGIRDMLERLIGENITIDWQTAPDLWPVRIDPSQVDQILTNLAVNSRDAIRGAGTVRVRTANCEIGDERASAYPGSPPGDYVELTVEDDGVGMDAATAERAFDPFFTTKDVGKGTGLGLAVVYGIVKQYRGVVEVESARGRGTLIRILLPAWRGGPDAEPADSTSTRPPRGQETILVVEDEEQILSLARRALEREGYRVVSFGNPLEALEAVVNDGKVIDLIVTDVVMPGLTGRDLARRIQAVRPGTPCLFMSGYPADVIADHGVIEEGIELLQKPFTVRELADKVRTMLDR
ncbi:MAG: response regulator, partial [Gemmatimonadetes bacterium]|nr:response regulator [Gemmatimonadota bacterium]